MTRHNIFCGEIIGQIAEQEQELIRSQIALSETILQRNIGKGQMVYPQSIETSKKGTIILLLMLTFLLGK